MTLIVTIDTGTTNTRVRVWREEQVVAFSAAGVGVRDTSITGSRDPLKAGVKAAVAEALAKAGLEEAQVDLFLGSGMITSNVGLFEVPHVAAPAGLQELAAAMVGAALPEVLNKPLWLVPGVKNALREVTVENCEAMDIMRGEEVETFGALHRLGRQGPALLVLPGSHSKFVQVDAQNRIGGCVTTLAGELLAVLTTGTILAGSLDKAFAEVLDEEMALRGAAQARQVGLNRTCFTVRILNQFTGGSRNARANFLAGAVVGTDLLAIQHSAALSDCRKLPVVIGGTNLLARVFELLMRNDPFFQGQVVTLDEASMQDTAGLGAILVAKERGLV